MTAVTTGSASSEPRDYFERDSRMLTKEQHLERMARYTPVTIPVEYDASEEARAARVRKQELNKLSGEYGREIARLMRLREGVEAELLELNKEAKEKGWF